MAASTSIWDVERPPANREEIKRLWRRREVWKETASFAGDTGGGGGRMFMEEWFREEASAAMMRFAENLLELLRYNTLEIFLSKPRAPTEPRGNPIMVAAAYRSPNEGKVYRITHPWLRALKEAILNREPQGITEERVQRYLQATEPTPLTRYIDYALIAACIAIIARLVERGVSHFAEDDQSRAAGLWRFLKEYLKLPQGCGSLNPFPPPPVRAALRGLVCSHAGGHPGAILLEQHEADQPDFNTIFERAGKWLEKERKTASGNGRLPAIDRDHFERAWMLWKFLSEQVETIGTVIRAHYKKLPGRLWSHLFRAPFRIYPAYLASVTHEVAARGVPVLVGDLERRIDETATWRNQFVHVPAKESYEQVADKVLFAGIRSMLLIPFEGDLLDSRFRYTGFVRLMNRYQVHEQQPQLRLYHYPGRTEELDERCKWTTWDTDQEERELALALSEYLGEVLFRDDGPLRRGLEVQYPALQPRPTWEQLATDEFMTRTGIYWCSDVMGKVVTRLRSVADTDTTVTIIGESGTGKELVARAIHDLSRRAVGPFVEVNSAAIPRELIESELFGHMKGSFTGALEDRPGKFEQADGGTLFLDEVGDMSPETQAKVLRALEAGVVTRVGATKPVPVNVRVIAATNKDLPAKVETREFRDDLWFRLSQEVIRIPPLRERRDDILVMADPVLREAARLRWGNRIPPSGLHVSLSEEATRELAGWDYKWPGNVRELRTFLGFVLGEVDACLRQNDGRGVLELTENFVITDELIREVIPEYLKQRTSGEGRTA